MDNATSPVTSRACFCCMCSGYASARWIPLSFAEASSASGALSAVTSRSLDSPGRSVRYSPPFIFHNPDRNSDGIGHVFVNGRAAVEDGVFKKGILAGDLVGPE